MTQYPIGVWNETAQQWQTLWLGEKAYQILMKSIKEFKRKYDTFREPYIIYSEGEIKCQNALNVAKI